jgi:hypothetical protein
MRLLTVISCCSLMCLAHFPAFGQDVSITQALSFGSFTVNNNNASHNLVVQRTGGYSADAGYTVLDNPVPAEWALTSFPSSTLLNVVFDDVTNITKLGGGGEYFSMTSFTPTPSLSTDGLGAATLRFGATLVTSGTGTNYTDGTYTGTYDVTINY